MSSTTVDTPAILTEFLNYERVVRQLSATTISEYKLDLQTFFRFLKRSRGLVSDETPFDEIPIQDVDIPLLQSVTLTQLYDYLSFAGTSRPKFHRSPETAYGDAEAAISRKVSSLRTFYRYLTAKRAFFDNNPTAELENPIIKKSLPRYLTAEEADNDVKAILAHIADKYSDKQVNTIDGVKIDFDNGWVHLRPSNTEPIIRIYAEAETESLADNMATKIIGDIREFLRG